MTIVSFANVGNHLHFHVKLGNRFTYVKFICAVTAAIAVTVGKCSRWNKNRGRFWDLRPFTRALSSYREYRILQDYVRLNGWEGSGRDRSAGAVLLKRKREIEDYFRNIQSLIAGENIRSLFVGSGASLQI